MAVPKVGKISSLKDRSVNIIDGTYVKVPDPHVLDPSKNIGLREFNNGVLIHNWYEERNPAEVKEFKKNSTYNYDYKPFPGAQPDIFVRRNMIRMSEGVGNKNLIGMHNFDSSKSLITTYDETINKRPRPGPAIPHGQQFPENREWKIINDKWAPEKIDFPLQDSPTKWGLVDKKRNEKFLEDDKYKNQIPNVSEYFDRYQTHSKDAYLQRTISAVPKEISASFNKLNLTLNNQPKPRSYSGSLREPQARDVLDTVYANMLIKSSKAPRTFHYLGKVPTNGLLDVYSMKNYETLTPVHEPQNVIITDQSQKANQITDLKTLSE
ncbi:unnamed protein product [Brachionus calyciflorus]|uniref:Uncharacterized protein n=1 Tax=Brachionus calyciflorus TaxID=104777 RepID=A0A814IW62_9BILA|nr:unnamed protein product [Brachionus calyciflorus]